MKFELKPFSRKKCVPSNGLSDDELLSDLACVARQLNKSTVTSEEYRAHGKFGSKALVARFGHSWLDVLNKAGLGLTRSRVNVSTQELVEDVKRVAEKMQKQTLTQEEYDDGGGKFSASNISKRFGGSWLNVIESVCLERSRQYRVSEEEYFQNIEEVWIKLGRQPLYREIEKPLSRYSAGAYERKFGTWRKALEAFVAFMNAEDEDQNGNEPSAVELSSEPVHRVDSKHALSDAIGHKTKRQVSDRLRFKVFYRDGMTCQICGKSRSKYQELQLVVDHKVPWSKGGETVFENLQTLCRPCNGGKGDLSLD